MRGELAACGYSYDACTDRESGCGNRNVHRYTLLDQLVASGAFYSKRFPARFPRVLMEWYEGCV
jgi:hypothetical protein